MDPYTPERWARISELIGDALQIAEDEREAFLDTACAGDAGLRSDVERLLKAHRKAESTGRFDRGALDLVPLAFPEPAVHHDVPGYRLVREVGRGGMGSVWLAERADGLFEQRVAIKIMRSGHLAADLQRRFEAERRILARLEHPNIARILGGGMTGRGEPFLAIEYVEGRTITDYCRDHALGVRDRLRLFLSVCRAVAYAHQNLVVHRDLKPSNILVSDSGVVKLLDFGIAKLLAENEAETDVTPTLTRTGMSMMTPEYAAPEQITGSSITTATDVYALGVVLYELLTGSRPYRIDARTPGEIERIVCHTDVARPSTAARAGSASAGMDVSSDRLVRTLRGDLDAIVLKALRKESARRFGSAEQLAEDLQRYLDGLPITTRSDTFAYRAAKFVRRYRKSVIATTAIILTLIGGIVATTWQARIAERERRLAERRFEDVRQLALTFLFEFHDAIRDLPGATPARELVVDRALEVLAKLEQESADDPSLQVELAEAYRRVGDVLGNPTNANLGRTQDALASYHRAITILESVPADEARARLPLAVTRERLADVLATTGDLAAADASMREAVSEYTRLAAQNPHDAADQIRLAVGLIKHADLQGNPNFANRGDTSAALEGYAAALPILEAVHSADSANSRAFRLLGLLQERLGTIYDAMGAQEAATGAYRNSLEIRRRHASNRPFDLDARRDLAIAHEKMGLAAAASGDYQEAQRRLRFATEAFRSLAEADSQNVQAWHSLAISLLHEGDVAAASDGAIPRAEQVAASRYREALDLMQNIIRVDPSDTRTVELTELLQSRVSAGP